MASERQIEANRRNSRRSTGPRTPNGIKRTRNNARRHGLAAVLHRETSVEIETLTLQFASGSVDPIILEHARVAAHAQFTMARMPRWKIAFIEHAYAIESMPKAISFQELMKGLDAWERHEGPRPTLFSAPTTPPGCERLTEAIRLALPGLAKLERYEQRAFVTRHRALRAIARFFRRREFPQNEANFVQQIQ
jgi:hypothetical protein